MALLFKKLIQSKLILIVRIFSILYHYISQIIAKFVITYLYHNLYPILFILKENKQILLNIYLKYLFFALLCDVTMGAKSHQMNVIKYDLVVCHPFNFFH